MLFLLDHDLHEHYAVVSSVIFPSNGSLFHKFNKQLVNVTIFVIYVLLLFDIRAQFFLYLNPGLTLQARSSGINLRDSYEERPGGRNVHINVPEEPGTSKSTGDLD